VVSVEESDNDDEDPVDDYGSEHSAKFQMGYQVSSIKPYKGGSFISDKAGELVGAIHLLLVCRVLRSYTKGKTLVFPLVDHGLQIHKVSGIIHIIVIFHKDKMKAKPKIFLMANYR